MRPANERRRYMIVTLSLIGGAHAQNEVILFNKWKINSLATERCSTYNLKSVILKDTYCGLSSRALLIELLSGKHLDLL